MDPAEFDQLREAVNDFSRFIVYQLTNEAPPVDFEKLERELIQTYNIV